MLAREARGRPFGSRRTRFLNVSDITTGLRENLGGLIGTWIAATGADDDAVLALKWYHHGGPDVARSQFEETVSNVERIVGRSAADAAPIELVTDWFAEEAMPGLYAACTHYLSVSNGEGWDLPMVEAGAAGLRLIAPDHSAYRAYLNETIATLIPSAPAPVHPRDWLGGDGDDLLLGIRWWKPDLDAARDAVTDAIAGRDAYRSLARDTMLREFSWERAAERLLAILGDDAERREAARVRCRRLRTGPAVEAGGAPARIWPDSETVAVPDSRVGPIRGFRGDRFLTASLANSGTWAPAETKIAEESLREGMNVLDIGANIGYFTLLFSQLVGPCGRVVAVEADPRIFEVLAANLSFRDASNVEAINAAADAEPGVACLHRDRFADNPGATYVTPGAGDSSVEVPAVALDDLLDPEMPIHYVKCDIQGYEHRALHGLCRTIRRWRPSMLVEWYPAGISALGDAPGDVLEFYRGLGYDILVSAEYVPALEAAGDVGPVLDGRLVGPGVSGALLDLLERSEEDHLNLVLRPRAEP